MKFSMKWIEFAMGLGFVVLVALVFLPSLNRTRESARRSSCINNLKEFGIVFKMYAAENAGEAYPPLSATVNNWIPAPNAIYPEYLPDPSILVCPTQPYSSCRDFYLKNNREHPGHNVDDLSPDCFSSSSYVYTGYKILNDEQAAAFFDAYYGIYADDLDKDLCLNVVVEQNRSEQSGEKQPEQIPVMWDRIPLDENEFSHKPYGGNVLYQDGHVEFQKYSYYNTSGQFPITRISAETFGSVLPHLSSDCYNQTQ